MIIPGVAGSGTLLFACVLLAGGLGCPGSGNDPDGGAPREDGGDGGGQADGGDAGVDAGCADPGCLPCASGGSLCGDGGVCRDGGCVPTCAPGLLTCNGPREQACGDGGTWLPPESCGVGGRCLGDACVAVNSCAADTPPCCSQPADCGNMAELFTCSECRPTIRTIGCLSGDCQVLPASLDFTVLGDAGALFDPTQVASGIVTLYRGETADGRVADCETLLSDATGISPHDDRDPQLNPTISRPYEFTGGTGSDLFTALVLGPPGGADQTIVFTVYDGTRGRGIRLGRGCVDHVTPLEGQTVILDLLP